MERKGNLGDARSLAKSAAGFVKAHKLWFLLALAAVAVAYPWLVPTSYLRGIGTKMLMYAVFAGSLNIINGYSGQFTLGHAGFICIGAYTGSLMMTRLGVGFWLALPCAGIVSGIFGFLISFPTRKLSGLYLTIVTLGFGEIIRIICLNWTSVTGGALGIKSIPAPQFFGINMRNAYCFYYIIFALLLLMLFCTHRVLNSRVGRAWISIRENQTAAASLGVNTTFYKGINLMYGAFWAGLIGAFQASYMQFIDPTMYGTEETFNIMAMTIVGGMGTLGGPIVGSLLINLITEVFRFTEQYRMLIYAVLIIAMMWIRPQGIAGAANSAMVVSSSKRRRRRKNGQKEGALNG